MMGAKIVARAIHRPSWSAADVLAGEPEFLNEKIPLARVGEGGFGAERPGMLDFSSVGAEDGT